MQPPQPIFDLVAEPVSPAPYSVAPSHSSAVAMAPVETELTEEDRTPFIDCCVDWWYHFVNYLFAQKIGVSLLVFFSILVVILESSPSLAEAPLTKPRSLRSENRKFSGPDTQLPQTNFQEIAMWMSVGVCGLIFSYSCLMQAAPMWAGGFTPAGILNEIPTHGVFL